MKIFLITTTTALVFFGGVANAQTSATCADQYGNTYSCNVVSNVEQEGRFCAWMREPSQSQARLRDRVKYLCEQEGHEVCSKECFEIYMQGNLQLADEWTRDGLNSIGKAGGIVTKKVTPYFRELANGFKEGKQEE